MNPENHQATAPAKPKNMLIGNQFIGVPDKDNSNSNVAGSAPPLLRSG